MRKAKLSVGALTLAAFALAAVACGGFMNQVKQSGEDAGHLQAIGIMYKNYVSSKKKPPTGPDDLLPLATSQPDKDAVQAIKDGKLVVNWGYNLDDNSQFPLGQSNYVLAYAKAALADQRFLVTADGVVINLKEPDFQTKLKNTPGKK